MDHIDHELATNVLRSEEYVPTIRASLALVKKTLNCYYNMTDWSEVYRIAMESLCCHQGTCIGIVPSSHVDIVPRWHRPASASSLPSRIGVIPTISCQRRSRHLVSASSPPSRVGIVLPSRSHLVIGIILSSPCRHHPAFAFITSASSHVGIIIVGHAIVDSTVPTHLFLSLSLSSLSSCHHHHHRHHHRVIVVVVSIVAAIVAVVAIVVVVVVTVVVSNM
ncbi:hypothetical protein EW146_g7146 [Bondarzewia mesenterica]|uniref:Uncharacterized protein n=1 Tax=Bondarzewia mesenterica TaxID=1095465 RepID=A0A4S4LM68_9AGAM|nr:hypothetical protein EW146_g7146 [Bondarzewia mesenterica]